MLILAGVSIATLTGQNGLLTRSKDAKIVLEQAKILEELRMKIYEKKLDIENETTIIQYLTSEGIIVDSKTIENTLGYKEIGKYAYVNNKIKVATNDAEIDNMRYILNVEKLVDNPTTGKGNWDKGDIYYLSKGDLYYKISDTEEQVLGRVFKEKQVLGGEFKEEEKIEKPNFQTTQLSATSFEINITNQYSGDIEFEYYVNKKMYGERCKNTQYTVSNVELEETYEMEVYVYKNGKKVSSSTETVKNNNYVVVFDSANSNAGSIAGGWRGFVSGGTAPSKGSTSVSGDLSIETHGYWVGFNVMSQNKIDVSGYSKVVFEISNSFFNTGGVSAYAVADFGVASESSGPWSSTNFNYVEHNITNMPSKAEYPIQENTIKNGYVTFGACNGANVSVSKIYLLK